jgi:hypothetical protein
MVARERAAALLYDGGTRSRANLKLSEIETLQS